MAGADFGRADLHIHTFADRGPDPEPDFDAYVQAALDSRVGVIAITDHNTARFCAASIKAAEGTGILVLPGVEISTFDGHLLALFAPPALETLEGLISDLRLEQVSEFDRKTRRSMLDLVETIDGLGGLAIPAHIDPAMESRSAWIKPNSPPFSSHLHLRDSSSHLPKQLAHGSQTTIQMNAGAPLGRQGRQTLSCATVVSRD
jgi:hypothetical protein